jgi:hypothetical protein
LGTADIQIFDAWDPLDSTSGADPGIVISAQKREISNILKSYTGYYDLFAELIQNALDAVEKRVEQDGYLDGQVWVSVDLKQQIVTVTDNGCGMDEAQFKQFLRPNFSFKSGPISRGSKGVGATYLGYGFNHLHISTRIGDKIYSGLIENGRAWVEDTTGTIPRPRIIHRPPMEGPFNALDRGTSITVKLSGSNIRPKSLAWNQASTASQWLALLRIMTPIGGIYLAGTTAPKIKIHIKVINQSGEPSEDGLDNPNYLYPHENIAKSVALGDFIDWQTQTIKKGNDATKIPAKFTRLNGLWGAWSAAELLGEVPSNCPIQLRLDSSERQLAKEAQLSIYLYLAFSTDLYDGFNDTQLKLRKGSRFLHGGLQLSTRHMPQGPTLTIPMTNNIGFQNLAHVIVHFDNAEPDLGRKGFQPEFTQLAEKISVSAVTAFRKRYSLLRKPGAAKIFGGEIKIEQWIRNQEEHEKDHALTITGAGLFLPTEELPIRSEPRVEQDVVALFNQMLSSGLVRGIQLISSSQFNQYDGLYRVRMDPPFDKFILGSANPLGIEGEFFNSDEPYISKIKVLEYKHSLDSLVEEFQSGVKAVEDIGLVVTWEMHDKWRQMFDAVCLFDEDNTHHRQIHGTTHSFTHSVSGNHAFEAIILKDLVAYLKDPKGEVARQRKFLDQE